MVQILPRNRPTFGEHFAGGFEKGLSQASEMQKLAQQAALEQKSKQAEMERKLTQAKELENLPGFKDLDPIEQFALKQEVAGLIGTGSAKSLINLQREKAERNWLEENLGDIDQEISGTPSAFMEEEDIEEAPRREKTKVFPKFSNEKLLKMSVGKGPKAEFAKNALKMREEERGRSFQEGKELRKETLPVRKEYSDKARSAQAGIENKQKLLEVIKTGNINDPTYSIIAQALPFKLGERMLSPESVVYRAGMIDEFKDLRSIFQGQTRIKEIDLLEDKVAGLYLTDAQKEAVLSSRMDALKADVIRGEVAAELEAEGKFGGALQFQKLVEERAKPRLEALFNRILDQQKAIIKDAENHKAISLDPNDPSDAQIARQILIEAKGDRVLARKIAKKRGYKF